MLDLRTALSHQGIDAELIDLKVPMKTAQAAADELQVSVERIFKSLVLRGASDDEVAVVVLDGEARVDLRVVCKILGWKKARFASSELVLEATGYPAGGTPPVGHRRKLTVIVDQALLAFPDGYAGGGRPELLLRIAPGEIIRATSATVADVRQASN